MQGKLMHRAITRQSSPVQSSAPTLRRQGTAINLSKSTAKSLQIGLLLVVGLIGILLFSDVTTLSIMRLFGSSRPIPNIAAPLSQAADYVPTRAIIESALWAFFSGDALSSPTHWFYGGFSQIQSYYGTNGITGYTKPVFDLPGSILNKSNLAGGGRSSPRDKMNDLIIGSVINHGKQDYWNPSKNIHYHATLQAGEPTLEAQLARVLMKSIVANKGHFQADHFRQAYVDFMTTPGSHNDTYASTCHRMFFANYHYRKMPPQHCPDNDRHNVDTIDGLVLPTITALAVAARVDGTLQEAREQASATAAVTRRSDTLEKYAAAWGQLVYRVVRERVAPAVAAEEMRDELRLANSKSLMTACYLDTAVPSLLTMISFSNYSKRPVWESLLRNANVGGENVHRGSCLGAILGADEIVGEDIKAGLYPRESIELDVKEFAAAVVVDNGIIGATEGQQVNI